MFGWPLKDIIVLCVLGVAFGAEMLAALGEVLLGTSAGVGVFIGQLYKE